MCASATMVLFVDDYTFSLLPQDASALAAARARTGVSFRFQVGDNTER